ncbi:MAG: ATP-binding cassette domain-containing protein, partial [Rhodospirillales bacterium]|nr:ATP-binding cassette domain-containing protein [Rhodospirillales bacterium]
RIKYEQIVISFDAAGNENESRADVSEIDAGGESAAISVRNLTTFSDGVPVLNDISLEIPMNVHTAIVGETGSGKSALIEAIAGLSPSYSGWIGIANHPISSFLPAARAKMISYVDNEPAFMSGTIMENLLYAKQDQRQAADSSGADIAPYNLRTLNAVLRATSASGMEKDLVEYGLRSNFNPNKHLALHEKILAAREKLKLRQRELEKIPVIEHLEMDRFTDFSTIFENLIFGKAAINAPARFKRDLDHFLFNVLRKTKLDKRFMKLGYEVATKILHFDSGEAAADRSSVNLVMDSDELNRIRSIVASAQIDRIESLGRADQRRLVQVAYRVTPGTSTALIISSSFKEGVVAARKQIMREMPKKLGCYIEYFRDDDVHSSLSLRENIIFGKIMNQNGGGLERLAVYLNDVIAELEMQDDVARIGLDFQAGFKASLLSNEQRQRLAIARGLVNQSRMLILNDAISLFDYADQLKMIENICRERQGQGVLWALQNPRLGKNFDQLITLSAGKVVN